MKAKIKAEINSGGCPVWLSPKIGETTLTMLQNFSISLERIASFDESFAASNGPGDVPCVIIRSFSQITSKNIFESAELTYSTDENWSVRWLDDDLGFFIRVKSRLKKAETSVNLHGEIFIPSDLPP